MPVLNPRANQWRWPCQPTKKMKPEKLLGYESSFVEEALGSPGSLRFHTAVDNRTHKPTNGIGRSAIRVSVQKPDKIRVSLDGVSCRAACASSSPVPTITSWPEATVGRTFFCAFMLPVPLSGSPLERR